MREAVIFLADGTEECEALIVVDVLRRAGVDIQTVSVEVDKTVMTSHSIPVACDESLLNFQEGSEIYMIIPGGLKGTDRMKGLPELKDLLEAHRAKGGKLAAVCAGPTVLGHFGLIKGKEAAVFPGCEAGLGEDVTYLKDARVHKDDWLITGRGLGVSFDFALAILADLRGQEEADKLSRQIQYTC